MNLRPKFIVAVVRFAVPVDRYPHPQQQSFQHHCRFRFRSHSRPHQQQFQQMG